MDVMDMIQNPSSSCYNTDKMWQLVKEYYCQFLPDTDCITIDGVAVNATNATTEAYTSSLATYTTTTAPFMARINPTSNSDPTRGYLEIYKYSQWYTACYYGMSDSVANMACKFMGFGGGYRYSRVYRSSYGYYIDVSSCPASGLPNCYFYTRSYCSSNYLAVISCYESSVTCDFQDTRNFCGYTNNNWSPVNGELVYRGGSASSSLTSPKFTTAGESSVRFSFKLASSSTSVLQRTSSSAAVLTVIIHHTDSDSDIVESYNDYPQGQWIETCLNLPPDEDTVLTFTGSAEQYNYYGVIHLDNVTLSDSPCEAPFPDNPCTFGDRRKCNYEIQCNSEVDPKPYQWRMEVENTSIALSSSTGAYMCANASFGEPGDVTTFTLHINTSNTGYLRVQYQKTPGKNDQSSMLQINYIPADGSNSLTVWESANDDTSEEWQWLCVPMATISAPIVNGQLEFKSTRGHSYDSDVSVAEVKVTDEACPHFASCTFDSKKMCRYSTNSESSFAWMFGSFNNNMTNGGPKYDHTSKYGGFAYARTFVSGSKEGDKADISTPVFKTVAPKRVMFYFYMRGEDVGTFKALVNWNDGSTQRSDAQLTVVGDQGDQWYLACVDIPASQDAATVTFRAEHGDEHNSAFALDDVVVEDGSCPVPLMGTMCTVENPFLCQYQSNCTEGSTFQWSRGTGPTPSTGTGPEGDASGSKTGHFLYVEGSSGKTGDISHVWFPALKITKVSSLHFWYHMWGSHVGKLMVVLQKTSTGSLLHPWEKSGNQHNVWHRGCIDLAGDLGDVQVHFVATKGSGFQSDMAIDNIMVKDTTCPVPTASCDFEDEFMCLYQNISSKTQGWMRASYDDTNYGGYSMSKSGHYMIASSSSLNSSAMISPEFSHNSKTCVKFEYLASVTDSRYQYMVAGYPDLSVTLHSSSSVDTNLTWISTAYYNAKWGEGQFQISSDISTPGLFRLVFEASNFSIPAHVAIDNVTVTDGECQALVCQDSEFTCTDRCILQSRVCNKVLDCMDESDENSCNRSISCDFEHSYHCGYTNISQSSLAFNWVTRLSINNSPYTIYGRNGRGYFLGYHASYTSGFPQLQSPRQRVDTDSCLHLHYVANRNLLIEIYDGIQKVKEVTINRPSAYSNNGVWLPAQTSVPAGDISFRFSFNHSASYNQYGALDDVTLTTGQCGPLDCPSSMFECDPGMCYPDSVMCDRRRDCISGNDELNCNYTINCDFENTYLCGYSVGSSFVRRGSDYLHRPQADHTYGDSRGHFLHFESKTLQTVSITTPTEDVGDGCLSFYYNMEGGVASEVKVILTTNGTQRLAYFANGVSVKRDEWVLGEIPVKAGRINLQFIGRTGPTGFKPSTLALDDIQFVPGRSCTRNTTCSSNEFLCNKSGICIPYYLVKDGIQDCLDGSDEAVTIVGTRPGEVVARLVGGVDGSYGRVEVLEYSTSTFKAVCERYWEHQYESQTVCRQLGYRAAVRTYKESAFGATRTNSYLNKYFSCGSHSAYLNDTSCRMYTTSYCYSSSYKPTYHSHISVACSNSECMYGEMPCQPGNYSTECVPNWRWCDSVADCPNGEDERNCANCTHSEWECLDHTCVPDTQRCDGIPQCPDASDEYRCVKHNNNSGMLEVHSGSQWGVLCYDNIDRTTADYLCSLSGSGGYIAHYQSVVVSNGLLAVASGNSGSVVPHRSLQRVGSCHALRLHCSAVECGVQSTSPLETMVLYGNDALPGEWPWQVGILRSGTRRICGGVILDPYWILTAAHCVDDTSTYSYSIGAGTINDERFSSDGQVRSVRNYYLHPAYSNPDTATNYSDIALLRLSAPLLFNNYTRPVCLGHSEDWDMCYVTGWGYRYYESSSNYVSTDILQEAQVRITPNAQCKQQWSPHFSITYVQDDVVCVDNREPFDPACYGDSGGPLVCQNRQGRWELIGITSRGYPGCMREYYLPSLYTSVPQSLAWIRSTSGLDIDVPPTPAPGTPPSPQTTPPTHTPETTVESEVKVTTTTQDTIVTTTPP